MNRENGFARIRIKKDESDYNNKIAEILSSNSNGTFKVVVSVEGNPIIDLKPEEVEPC